MEEFKSSLDNLQDEAVPNYNDETNFIKSH